MAKKENRVMVVLACQECKRRNYNTQKNKQHNTDRLELSKYCRFCRCAREPTVKPNSPHNRSLASSDRA